MNTAAETMRFSENRDGLAGRVIRFILCILACLAVIYLIGPAIDRLDSVKPLIDFIEERGIDAGALYYTEIEEFSEANINMENTMDFPPKGPFQPGVDN